MSLPSSVADFVPCDRLLQKAYSAFAYNNYILKLSRFCVSATGISVLAALLFAMERLVKIYS